MAPGGQSGLRKLFFHCDTDSVMIRQTEKVEQVRHAKGRLSGMEVDSERCHHDFDEDINFSWVEVTRQKHEKNIFTSFYLFLSDVAVNMIVKNIRAICRLKTTICDSFLGGGGFFVSSSAVGSHISSLMSMRAVFLLLQRNTFLHGHVAILTEK